MADRVCENKHRDSTIQKVKIKNKKIKINGRTRA